MMILDGMLIVAVFTGVLFDRPRHKNCCGLFRTEIARLCSHALERARSRYQAHHAEAS